MKTYYKWAWVARHFSGFCMPCETLAHWICDETYTQCLYLYGGRTVSGMYCQKSCFRKFWKPVRSHPPLIITGYPPTRMSINIQWSSPIQIQGKPISRVSWFYQLKQDGDWLHCRSALFAAVCNSLCFMLVCDFLGTLDMWIPGETSRLIW